MYKHSLQEEKKIKMHLLGKNIQGSKRERLQMLDLQCIGSILQVRAYLWLSVPNTGHYSFLQHRTL